MEIKEKERMLEWVNRVRALFGAPPVKEISKGCIGNVGGLCPIARMFQDIPDADSISVGIDGTHVRLNKRVELQGDLVRSVFVSTVTDSTIIYFVNPKYVGDFIVDFDAGEYPDLVIEVNIDEIMAEEDHGPLYDDEDYDEYDLRGEDDDENEGDFLEGYWNDWEDAPFG